MRIGKAAPIAALATIAAAFLVNPVADAYPGPVGGGGCFGGQLTAQPVPGTGSGGNDMHVNGNLLHCNGPALGGSTAAAVDLTYPYTPNQGAFIQSNGTIHWSNGETSNVSGPWQASPGAYQVRTNSTLRIDGGLGAGRALNIITTTVQYGGNNWGNGRNNWNNSNDGSSVNVILSARLL